jgi:hypothetical protein
LLVASTDVTQAADAAEQRADWPEAMASGDRQPGAAPAAETQDRSPKLERKKRYRDHVPNGFAGHPWGKPFVEFERLKQHPVSLQVAYSGMETTTELRCIPTATSECDLDMALATMYQRRTREGFHLLAEFVVPNQGFRFKGGAVDFYPVTYLFCAKWHGQTSKPPKGIENELRLCGARMVFSSQTEEQVRQMSDSQLTGYELVLEDLVRLYGKPYLYFRRPRVIVETEGGMAAEPRKRSFKVHRWCPPVAGGWVPSCEASIVMGMSPESGQGVVLYATPAIWAFARAREYNVRGRDPLYDFLYAL